MQPTVADVLAQTLREAGIKAVFGLPGGETAYVLDAMRRVGIEFVLVRNESSAVFMADVTARLTGKPGVCLTTLGPGAANAFVGVAHAYLDRSPVLVLTAQSTRRLIGRHTHQVLDLQAIFRPVTKQTIELTATDVGQSVRHALHLAVAGRPGPVHIGVSSETANSPAEHSLESSSQTSGVSETSEASAFSSTPSVQDLARAHALLSRARRPVLVVGLGLEPERPYVALRALAEAANAPVIVTPKAKGALPDDHPLAAGTIGLTSDDPVYEILDEADGVIAVGFDVVELVKPWEHPAPLLWIAPWANEDPPIPAAWEHVGSMTPALQQLADTAFSTASDWGAVRVAVYRQKLAEQALPSPAPGRMLPQAVLHAIRCNVPRETLITTDVGSHKILAALTWPAYVPNRYLVSNGLSTMSFGLPAAIAGAYWLGEPVICITGDGGLSMVVGELGLAAERNLPVITVMMHDAALDLIRSWQLRRGKPAFGTEFTNPDYAYIAKGYGLDFYRVATEAECGTAVAEAFARARPALIEAMIDPIGYSTTPIPSRP